MRKLSTNPNVDNSNPSDFPDGRIKNNTGSNDGTPVDERVYGDLHQTVSRLMRLYGITPNNLPDNITNGFQIVDALRALASKNDFILPITSSAGVLQVPIKIGLMLSGEQVVCKAGVDWTAETTITGTDVPASTVAFVKIGEFKADEYIRMIKTGSTILLVRLVDQFNVDAVVGELNYLKAAVYSDELAGTSNGVATNPLSNALIFVERVNGASSSVSLANAVRNGLYSKEHWAIVDGLAAVRNRGAISGLDPGAGVVGNTVPSAGDFTSAELDFKLSQPNYSYSIWLVTMANAMDNLNYTVDCSIESQGATMGNDALVFSPVVRPITTTTFKIAIWDFTGVQSLKVNMKVTQNNY